MADAQIPHLKIFGCSDSFIETYEVYGDGRRINEIDCLGMDVIVEFTDKTVIQIHYCKDNDQKGIWKIAMLNCGHAKYRLIPYSNENSGIYSDIFEIEAKIWTLDRVPA